MVLEIIEIMAFLENGAWHSFEDIRRNCSLSDNKINTFLGFLTKFDLILKNNSGQTLRLNPRLNDLLSRLKHLN